jgi:hypothetical protein
VIVSPKDLAHDKAIEHATQYRADGADLLLDPQFYVPESTAGKIGTYPTAAFRQSITTLGAVTERDLDGLARALEDENRKFNTSAVIAPALPYEAARPDIVALNSKLFRAAKKAGNAIGVPTYGTVAISQTLSNMELVEKALSGATAEEADGWYSTFEFKEERLPTDVDDVFRFANASLTLACTGAPVLHAFAGPLSILSFGSGATGTAVSFWKNLWGFNRERWKESADQQGGGGNAPPRYFSVPLWGTIVYPDETLLIDRELRREIMQGLFRPHRARSCMGQVGVLSAPAALRGQQRDRYRVRSDSKGRDGDGGRTVGKSDCPPSDDRAQDRASRQHLEISAHLAGSCPKDARGEGAGLRVFRNDPSWLGRSACPTPPTGTA